MASTTLETETSSAQLSDIKIFLESICQSHSSQISGANDDILNKALNKISTLASETNQFQDEYLGIINGKYESHGSQKRIVTIVGAGISGLCAGYELKRAGFEVHLLEASSRVGGRIITFRDPVFAPDLHAEGGAMRIPDGHYLTRGYISKFSIDSLVSFEMKNKFIHLSGYKGGSTLSYKYFEEILTAKEADNSLPARQVAENLQAKTDLLKLFPDLESNEKGKTCDTLFANAVEPVVVSFCKKYNELKEKPEVERIAAAYETITNEFDNYTLRSYLQDHAKWSLDAIRLYDLGNSHVVLENSFIESFKDAFLSSNDMGVGANMQQLKDGMDRLPKAFISPKRGDLSLINDITFGARVTHLKNEKGTVRVIYETPTGQQRHKDSEYVVLAIPYTAQRSITKSEPFGFKKEQAIREVRHVVVTKVLLQYRKRWWEDSKIVGTKGGGVVCDLPARYTMFPAQPTEENLSKNNRGVVMAAYTFQQDALILGAMSAERRVRTVAENLHAIFPNANSLDYLEAGTSQVFPSDELTSGSAFCYFGPKQKGQYLKTMLETDWDGRIFFAGEQASYAHGWIQGALAAGLRCVRTCARRQESR